MNEGIEIEMADYVDSLKDIKEIQKAYKDDDLTKQDIKEYRKIIGKLSWLANSRSEFHCLNNEQEKQLSKVLHPQECGKCP